MSRTPHGPLRRRQSPAPVFVAIAGGSGSGKSWLAAKLESVLHPHALRVSLDDFYRDRKNVPPRVRDRINFDNPSAIDWPLVEAVVAALAAGRPARIPRYDFKTHCRTNTTRSVSPKPFILMDGLWLLRRTALRRFYSLKIFINCSRSLRLHRRLNRDRASRGRSVAGIREQFKTTVEPMHRRYVEPQKKLADIILASDFGEVEVQATAETIRALSVPR